MPHPEPPEPSPRIAVECKRLAAKAANRRGGLLPRKPLEIAGPGPTKYIMAIELPESAGPKAFEAPSSCPEIARVDTELHDLSGDSVARLQADAVKKEARLASHCCSVEVGHGKTKSWQWQPADLQQVAFCLETRTARLALLQQERRSPVAPWTHVESQGWVSVGNKSCLQSSADKVTLPPPLSSRSPRAISSALGRVAGLHAEARDAWVEAAEAKQWPHLQKPRSPATRPAYMT